MYSYGFIFAYACNCNGVYFVKQQRKGRKLDMLDTVYSWMKNTAFYLVIMTAVLEVLPGNTYKKYVRFFTGLVLILLVLSPVLKWTGTVDTFRFEYKQQEEKFRAEMERQLDFEEEREEPVSVERNRIEVEEVKIGEMEESNMELDSFRE